MSSDTVATSTALALARTLRMGTSLIHVGSEPDATTGAVVPPISLSTTFAQASVGDLPGKLDPNSFGLGYDYSRSTNPTRGSLERCLAAAEGAAHGVGFSSGVAAISACMQLLKPGDKIIAMDEVYGGTQRLLSKVVTPLHGIEVTYMDFTDPSISSSDVQAASMIWLESPTNPCLKITDISRISSLNPNAITVVDNTFSTPYFQNPLQLGADVVVHSCTKSINGHSDVVLGMVLTNSSSLYSSLRFTQNAVGSVPSPFDCYLTLRGLKTLHVRMSYGAANALSIAYFLDSHAGVEAVMYPGLTSHPQHELAKAQMKGGYGMVVTVKVKGCTRTFMSSLKIFVVAEGLGAVESLVSCPAKMSHHGVPAETRKELGIDENLVRLSVGLESIDDLLKDLDDALSAGLKDRQI
ncbi:hypothetical protein TrVE_jg9610 [Triparma verrucosa]|uniref:cystathionine gamma-lyase n=1 Tax=Triparma verrucosa TaxID=1606542 RepID=A0A9W7FFC4_9STRA|nr:hypothetical protein TrVE_jg9610 [Triparma verrucosa]